MPTYIKDVKRWTYCKLPMYCIGDRSFNYAFDYKSQEMQILWYVIMTIVLLQEGTYAIVYKINNR